MKPGPTPIQQACAIPFRTRKGVLEFCLITSLRKGRWGFPKGIIDPGETEVQTALKEAHEEAGLRGGIVGEPLGSYEYSKWSTTLQVTAVLMEVRESHDQWPEANQRQRRWLDARQATECLANADQRRLLAEALRRLNPD